MWQYCTIHKIFLEDNKRKIRINLSENVNSFLGFLLFRIRRRHRVLGISPKKYGRLCQTNDMLATFQMERKEGDKGANNEKITDRKKG